MMWYDDAHMLGLNYVPTYSAITYPPVKPDYNEIIESISEGVILLDARGCIKYCNSSVCELFEYSKKELNNRPVEDLVPSKYRGGHIKLRQGFTAHPKKRSMGNGQIFPAITKHGSPLKVAVGLNHAKDVNGDPIIIATITDHTERERLLKKLGEEQLKAQQYLDLSKSIFLVLDREGKVKLVNREGVRILEYDESEMLGVDWFENFVEHDDAKWLKEVFKKIINEEMVGVELVQSSVRCKSGKVKLIEWHNAIIHDENGKPCGTISSGVDVTLREQTEKARTEAILKGIEQERKRIAGELHDGLVQTLSAISLNLKTIEGFLDSGSGNSRKAYRDALNLLELAIADTRRVSHDLMPTTIERYGLVKTLEDFAARMSSCTSLNVEIDPDHIDDYLDDFLKVNIYRIIQELIQNVIKHANATVVFIKIRRFDHSILLTVDDDGIGFNGTLEDIEGEGIGLKNVITRAKSMNGTFHIESKNNDGTHIDISFPASF